MASVICFCFCCSITYLAFFFIFRFLLAEAWDKSSTSSIDSVMVSVNFSVWYLIYFLYWVFTAFRNDPSSSLYLNIMSYLSNSRSSSVGTYSSSASYVVPLVESPSDFWSFSVFTANSFAWLSACFWFFFCLREAFLLFFSDFSVLSVVAVAVL